MLVQLHQTSTYVSTSMIIVELCHLSTDMFFFHSLFCIVVGFDDVRLVYDRETGKPKGYGFCEYQDLETAQSAMRNLNNHDFNGRPLRVGVAAGEQKDENRSMQQALGGPAAEVTLGITVHFIVEVSCR